MMRAGSGTDSDAYETLEIISELQSQLLRTDDRIIIYRITAEKIRKLLGEGIVIASILDESIQAMRVVAYYGLSVSLDRVVQILGMDPTQSVYYLKDMTDEELKTFRSGRLEHLEGGIRALLTRKAPQMLCDMIETLLGVDSVYTIAFVWQGQHLGGVTILTRQDLSSKRESIEMIMNQAAITINRIRVEAKLRQSEEKYRLIAENVADVITKLDMNLRILYVSPSIRRLLGFTPDEHKSRTIDQIMTRESFELVTKVLEEELRLRPPARPIRTEVGPSFWRPTARTVRVFWSKTPCHLSATVLKKRWGYCLSPGTSPSAKPSRTSSFKPRKWSRSDGWQEGWLTTTITCSV